MNEQPGLQDIRDAHARIGPYVHRTPVVTSATLDARAGAEVFMKCEHLQKAGAFKSRGACNAVFSLGDDVLARGVATHSSGNHGAALSRAARLRGTRAWIVMPRGASMSKQAAVRGYGGEIVFCDPDQSAREQGLLEVLADTSAEAIHPYDDWRIITGQATAALELLEQVPELDALVVPVGGGGLISGTALAARALHPEIRVIGVEPAGADNASRCLQAGQRVPAEHSQSIADGLRAALGERNFVIINTLVDEVVTVSDPAIVEAMRWMWERTKMLIEPSAATAVAALLEKRLNPGNRRIGLILSGGNVDLDRLPWPQGSD